MIKKYERKQYRTGEHSLSVEEANKLLNTCSDFTEKILLKVAIYGGIRRGDIVRLSWKDIDFQERTVSYDEKKKSRNRTIYFSKELMNEIKQLRSIHKEEHYLFPGRSNLKYGKGHISSKTAYNILQRNLVAARINQRPFHSLRATCVKLCQARGWSVEQAAKHIGDTVRVVQEHYSTPSVSEMKELSQEKQIL